jgi:hypothetical protein
MVDPMNRPEELRWGIFRGCDAVADGLLTPDDLQKPAWQRLRRDVYVDARVPLDHGLACHAVALSLPDHICFSGRSAAFLHGAVHAAEYEDEVHVTIAPAARCPRMIGVRVRTTELPPDDRDWADGLQVTSPARTAWDLGAILPAYDSVPIIDELLSIAVVSPTTLMWYAETRAGKRGSRYAAHAFEVADGRARSPQASRLRLAVMAAGLPRPIPHLPIQVGEEIREPELTWPAYRVGLEFHGRTARYAEADWLVLRIPIEWADVDLPGLLRELRAALLGRGWKGSPKG